MDAPPAATSSPQESTRWITRCWPWVLAAGMAAVLVVLWAAEPHGQPYYPRCLFYAMTGLQCPGCGGLRAVHALLHGDLAAAWKLNALFICYLPILAWAGACMLAARLGRRWPNPFAQPWMIAVLALIAMAFGVVRNIPGWGFR